MAIGDFLAGAGQVGAGIRRAQREVRADRLAQLQMEEANRVQQMYNQLNQEMRQGGLNYKGVTPGQMMELATVDVPKPTAPAKKTPAGVSVPTPAATANVKAAMSAISQGKDPTAVAPAVTTPLSGGAGTTNLDGGAGTDTLSPPAGVPIRPTGPGYDPYGRANQQFPNISLTQLLGGNPPAVTPAATGVTGAQPTEAEIAEMDARRLAEARAQAGVRPPEARPAAAQPTGDVSPAAPKTPKEVVASETAIAEQPVSPQTRTKANFYLADPTKITYEMQRTMDKREELVRYANIMLASRTAQGLQAFMQVKAQIDTIDGNMIELQGMQGLQELTDHNDPRRLAGVLSLMSGGNLAIQPRTDGKYNVIAAPGTASATPILEGASTDELSVYAMKRFSPAYRAQEMEDARALQMEATKTGFEIQKIRAGKLMDMSIAEMKATADLQKAILGYRGKVDAARIKAAADKAGIKLFNGGDGVIYGEGDNGVTYRLAPTTERIIEDNLIFPDVTVVVPQQLVPIQIGQGG